MKKTKLEKGITLVALIITIVVLLILAVASIGAVRNSGIIGHAQESANKNTVAQENEKIILALNEWKLQKNTPNNTTSFKAVIEAALQNEEVTIEGEENGPLTVTFTKTRNKYKITTDGEISDPSKITGTALEKYIFGQDLVGRPIDDIMKMGAQFIFIDDEETDEDETITIGANYLSMSQESYELAIIYFEIEDVTYRFAIDMNNTKTDINYGIVKVYNLNEENENSRVGKTVSYNDKAWTIMYDDDTKGLQMICNEVYPYNGNDFYLGSNDSLIYWDSLDKENEEFVLADLDNSGELDNDLEKSIYSYNNAITTLNTACQKLFKLENGNYKNSNIIDVRCVGSNPNKNNKDSENTTPYTSENLEKWPENNTTYVAGIGNGKGKSTDLNYVTDFDRMVALGINKIDTDYWLASRFIPDRPTFINFCLRSVWNDGLCLFDNVVWEINSSEVLGESSHSGIRPVIILNSNVQLNIAESGTTDYVL